MSLSRSGSGFSRFFVTIYSLTRERERTTEAYISTYDPFSSSVSNIDMSETPLTSYKTFDRYYSSYSDRFLKRNLAPAEYQTNLYGELHVPSRNKERLENEVACLKYIMEKTNIPVTQVLAAYEANGSFYLWRARVEGVLLMELEEEDRLKVLPEIRKHVATLQTIRSNTKGGPSGILCPHYLVTDRCDRDTTWQRISAKDSIFVFCHGNLSSSNIIVDPKTLKVVAIIDWEFAGYYPKEREILYFESRLGSGAQARKFPEIEEQIKQFWKNSCLEK